MAPLTEQEIEARLDELMERAEIAPAEAFTAEAHLRDDQAHRWADEDPAGFWAEQARALDWITEPRSVLDDSEAPFYRWFADGEINASVNCLDRHVAAGLGDRVAFHWCGEEGERRDITYGWLLEQVQRAANALTSSGVERGDVVGIYLPMIPEVVVAMLACARVGAPHNVVFGGFSPESVKERMEVSGAKALITVDGSRRKGRTVATKRAVDEAGMPVQTVFVVRHSGIEDCPIGERDLWWDEALAAADPVCEPAVLSAEHPLFILYSSGSTAKPKGILHTTGGYLTQVAWTHKHVFDLKADSDVYFCSADVGWITGHSYIVYGPLMNGCTSVMYEGAPDYPHKGIWWELCQELGVTIFYTAPTAIRACMKWGAEHVQRFDRSSLRLLGTVGEPINPKAWLWYWLVVGEERCPVVDTWWQTETGAIMVTTLPGAQPMRPGVAGRPLPGIDVAVLSEGGEELWGGRQGLLAIRRPWPAMLRTLFGDDERYVETYWSKWEPGSVAGAPGSVYFVGDAARHDEAEYLSVIGRVDDVINVSGHRLSTAEIESAIVAHHGVAEAAVIGQADEQTGQAICAFVTLEGERHGDDEMGAELKTFVGERIGKFARPARIVWADDLPKTRSGKIMRRLLRDVAEGRALGDVTTLRDPTVMQAISGAIASGAHDD
ncbi:MAG: acetate--CoA ligase [Baekduia sp.]